MIEQHDHYSLEYHSFHWTDEQFKELYDEYIRQCTEKQSGICLYCDADAEFIGISEPARLQSFLNDTLIAKSYDFADYKRNRTKRILADFRQVFETWYHYDDDEIEQTTVESYIKEQREPQNFFYSRVSTREQSQLRQVVPDCVPPENVFREVASGRDFKRPIYRDLVDNRLKEGDTLYVWSIDRFSRNLVDCMSETRFLRDKRVKICFLDEGQTVDWREDNPAKDLFFTQMVIWSDYTRRIMLRQQRQGIDAALEADKHLPLEQRRYKGRKSKLTDDHRKKASALYNAGFSISEIARDLTLDRATIRTMLKDLGLYNNTK